MGVLDGRGELRDAGEPHVFERDEWFHRLELYLQNQRISQGAVGVREAEEEVRVLVVSGRVNDLTGSREDVHRQHGFVRAAIAEARGLDAQSGDGPAKGDGAQLRDAQGDEAVCERGVGQSLVGREPADERRTAVRIYPHHPAERLQVELVRDGLPGPEKVGCLLAQTHIASAGPQLTGRPRECHLRRHAEHSRPHGRHGGRTFDAQKETGSERSSVQFGRSSRPLPTWGSAPRGFSDPVIDDVSGHLIHFYTQHRPGCRAVVEIGEEFTNLHDIACRRRTLAGS